MLDITAYGIQDVRQQFRNQKTRRQDAAVQEQDPASVAIGELGTVINLLNGIVKTTLPTMKDNLGVIGSDQEAREITQTATSMIGLLSNLQRKLQQAARKTNQFIPVQRDIRRDLNQQPQMSQ